MNLTPRQRTQIAGAVLACCTLAGVKLTHPSEGTVLHAYPDAVLGWRAPTACTGHMDPDLPRTATFSQAECDQMLHADLRKTYDAIAVPSCIGDVPLSDNELAAYLDLAFNVGPDTFCKGSFKTKLKAGDHAGSCDLIAQYRFVGGKDCAIAINNCGGIIRRRAAERALCMGGA